MKVLEKKYPLGSFPGQRKPGRYIDGTYYENLSILARKIGDDMTFLGLVSSSTLEVGTGKSTFVQQTGEIWTELVNEKYNTDLTFDMKNIVFNSEDLIDRAFNLPRYSCLILDEGDDLDTHYYSKLARTLRKFFRKCRQLNLFILVILPNFFQIPSAYAISRSVFFIDVRFKDEFERGYFSFYSFKKKKKLYIIGKKTQDYDCVGEDFSGRFLKGYAVPEQEYIRAKRLDMLRDNEAEQLKVTPQQELAMKIKIFKQIMANVPEMSRKSLALAFGVSTRTLNRWSTKDTSFLDEDDATH